MNERIPVVVKKRTFLSSMILGLSSLAIIFVICCTVLTMYCLHFAGEKTVRVISLAQSAVQGLPELLESLPPILADTLDDRRQPDYTQHLAIKAKLLPPSESRGGMRTGVEIVNEGKQVVSVLCLRIIVLDEQGQLRSEIQEWAATPLAAEGAWRGPIMPGARRYFECRSSLHGIDPAVKLKAEVEINELRIWNTPSPQSTSATEAVPELPGPNSPALELVPEV